VPTQSPREPSGIETMVYLLCLPRHSREARNKIRGGCKSTLICDIIRYMEINWNKDKVIALLESNQNAVEKAMVVLYDRQTRDEQLSSNTKHTNGRGFSGAHCIRGSYYARWVISGRKLSGNHLNKARAIALRYTSQLLEQIELNASKK